MPVFSHDPKNNLNHDTHDRNSSHDFHVPPTGRHHNIYTSCYHHYSIYSPSYYWWDSSADWGFRSTKLWRWVRPILRSVLFDSY